MSELKPCPFCGAPIDDFAGMVPEAFARCIERATFAMGCRNCDTTGPMKPSMEAAIEAWNTRTPSPVVSDEVVETVARAIERAWSRNHASIRSNPDIAWKVWTPEAEAAIEASGYAALKADNERMKEGLTTLHAAVAHSMGVINPERKLGKAMSNARTILQEVSR